MKAVYLFTLYMVCMATPGCANTDSIGNSKVFTSDNATATGGVDGGGGKGVICDSKVMTLDLYEAKNEGVQLGQDFGNLKTNLKFYGLEAVKYQSESLNNLQGPQVETEILNYLDTNIINKFKDISSGQKLKLTQDAHTKPLPTNCKMIQIAVYAKDGTIYRDLDYWSLLSSLDQAALILHETMYERARRYGSIDSDESRKAVGLIFSKNNSEYLLSPLWKNPKKFWCGAGIENSEQEIFEMYGTEEVQNNVQGLKLYFLGFKNTYVTLRTTTFLPKISFDQFLKTEFDKQSVIVENITMNKTWNLELAPSTKFKNNFMIRSYIQGEKIPYFSNGFCKIL